MTMPVFSTTIKHVSAAAVFVVFLGLAGTARANTTKSAPPPPPRPAAPAPRPAAPAARPAGNSGGGGMSRPAPSGPSTNRPYGGPSVNNPGGGGPSQIGRTAVPPSTTPATTVPASIASSMAALRSTGQKTMAPQETARAILNSGPAEVSTAMHVLRISEVPRHGGPMSASPQTAALFASAPTAGQATCMMPGAAWTSITG